VRQTFIIKNFTEEAIDYVYGLWFHFEHFQYISGVAGSVVRGFSADLHKVLE